MKNFKLWELTISSQKYNKFRVNSSKYMKAAPAEIVLSKQLLVLCKSAKFDLLLDGP